MNYRVILTIVACTFAMSVNNSASAAGATQDDANLCRGALTAGIQGKYDGATFKIKSMSGSALIKIKYRMRFNGERHIVICKIRKGEVIEIVWPDDLDRGTEEVAAPAETFPNDQDDDQDRH